MVPEAPLEAGEGGLVPKGEGWFVVNAREALWRENPKFGAFVIFEGRGDAKFEQLGINIGILEPGQPACYYHGEDQQEDFLVLYGEAVLLVEGEERRVKAWDFIHCPPWTEHVFVGAGEGPCAILAVGSRSGGELLYPASELAQRHGAGVEREVRSGDEAYAGTPSTVETPYREGWLPT